MPLIRNDETITDEVKAEFDTQTEALDQRLTALEARADTEITDELNDIVQPLNWDIVAYQNRWLACDDAEIRTTAFRKVIERFAWYMEQNKHLRVARP